MSKRGLASILAAIMTLIAIMCLAPGKARDRIERIPAPRDWFAWVSKDTLVVVDRTSGWWASKRDIAGRIGSHRYYLRAKFSVEYITLSPGGRWLVWLDGSRDNESSVALREGVDLDTGRRVRWMGPSYVTLAWMDRRRIVELSMAGDGTRISIRTIDPPRLLRTWVIPLKSSVYGDCQVVDGRWLIGMSLKRLRYVRIDLAKPGAPLFWYASPLWSPLGTAVPAHEDRIAWLASGNMEPPYHLWLSRSDGSGLRQIDHGLDGLINSHMISFPKRGGPAAPILSWRPGTDQVCYLGKDGLFLIRVGSAHGPRER